jgi:tetrapyrrole methylase family protein / MazG family protein
VITITGLGPGDFDRIPYAVKTLLLDPARAVVVRTLEHPAARSLAELRPVLTCDDLYESGADFDDVYSAISDRVLELSRVSDVVYAVPGSPMMGEFAVRKLVSSDAEVELIPSESFVDAILGEVGYDPFDRGLQILNGHQLPYPLVIDKPTIVGHLDRPEILADVAATLARVVPEDAKVTLFAGVGSDDAVRSETTLERIDPTHAGFRTSLFIDVEPGGLVGAVRTMERLRAECPWDREQTHQTLMKYLVEETYELSEAVAGLAAQDPGSEIDWVGYARVEDELGDVLLSVLFHAAIAREGGVFDIDDAAEVLRQKLIRRHPHVFGDVEVGSAAEVKENWDRIKTAERGGAPVSIMDGVAPGMPALSLAAKLQNRAAKIGFDWSEASEVMPRVRDELDELEAVLDDPARADDELGDVLFSVVNLARHLGLDGDLALRRATERFETRFRHMEAEGSLDGLDLGQLNERWERAKQI